MNKLTIDGCRLSVKKTGSRRLVLVSQSSRLCVLCILAAVLAAACGKKAPPIPRDEVMRKEAEKAAKEAEKRQ